MEKKYTVTLRLSYQQHAWLGTLCRRSKQTQSEVIRSLIENGSVRERITHEHIYIIRQLIGESTNLNQLARQANTYGFFAVADRCEEMAQHIDQLIKLKFPTPILEGGKYNKSRKICNLASANKLSFK